MPTERNLTHEELIDLLTKLYVLDEIEVLKNFKMYFDMSYDFIAKLEDSYFKRFNCKDFEDKLNLIYVQSIKRLTEVKDCIDLSLIGNEFSLFKDYKDLCIRIYDADKDYYMSQEYPIYSNPELSITLGKFIIFPMQIGADVGFYQAAKEEYLRVYCRQGEYLDAYENIFGECYNNVPSPCYELNRSRIKKDAAKITKLGKKTEE